MAALAELGPADLVNLRDLRGADLKALLEEETQLWRQRLHWDFTPSAKLIERYLDIRALGGYALWLGGRIRGYCYFVVDDHKALIGDLFLDDVAATPARESLLLESVLREAWSIGAVRRIEAQLLMRRYPLPDAEVLTFDRYFMLARTRQPSPSDPRPDSRTALRAWGEGRHEESAWLVARCYENHIDGQINDQYLTVEGTRRFLANIVAFPGCGAFSAAGSICAVDSYSGALLGVSLASQVAPGVGHITQLCVARQAQGRGIGRILLQASMAALRRDGCAEVSLTVTAANQRAVELYRSEGFQVLRDFSAHVWPRR
jgi:ribosomal protein S18 acetylase RimI-like enzyme